MDNDRPEGGWAEGLEVVPDPAAKSKALEQFATYLNPQKVRVMRAAGLDIIEAQRSGPWVWDLDGRRFLDCFTSAGSTSAGAIGGSWPPPMRRSTGWTMATSCSARGRRPGWRPNLRRSHRGT